MLKKNINIISSLIDYPKPKIDFGEYVFCMENFLAKHVDGVLYLSVDAGETYTKQIDITAVGNIRYIHIFQNGELVVCGQTKAYYSLDWITLNESTVLDINGDPFVPAQYDNFYTHFTNPNRQIVNGVEVLCWGNYARYAPEQYNNINIWYTIDKGQTIKSCFKFGTSIADGESSPLLCRHVHNVNFNPADNTFWAQTGDEDRNLYSHWIKGVYDTAADSWTWTRIGSGDTYKTCMMHFIGDYIYYAWDHPNGGVCRRLYTNAHLPESQEQLLQTPNDCIALQIGERGDMVALMSKFGGDSSARIIYYSPDGVNFYEVTGKVPANLDYSGATYYNSWPPNSQGKVLSGIFCDNVVNIHDWDKKPSVWIDDLIKKAGFLDAFKPLD